MSTKAKTEVIIMLNNGHTCTQAFIKRFQGEIECIVPAVQQGVLFTTEQLCGEEFWSSLTDWDKTLAGSCMIHLVEHGRVPFDYVPRPGRNPYPLQFQLKPTQ
jgi:hypothetical protein